MPFIFFVINFTNVQCIWMLSDACFVGNRCKICYSSIFSYKMICSNIKLQTGVFTWMNTNLKLPLTFVKCIYVMGRGWRWLVGWGLGVVGMQCITNCQIAFAAGMIIWNLESLNDWTTTFHLGVAFPVLHVSKSCTYPGNEAYRLLALMIGNTWSYTF